MLLTINQLSFSYGVHCIFKDLDFRVDGGEHIGLIGPNGCGKSTFFKVLTSELLPDAGTIHKKNGLTLGLLAQEFHNDEDRTAGDLFNDVFSSFFAMEEKMAQLEHAIDTADASEQGALVESHAKIQEAYAEEGGFDFRSRIRGITIGLGFSLADLEKSFSQFSGGEKTRLALGCLLLKEPDILLLDEPTNYLDFEVLGWLESFLSSYRGTFITVSHDRFFLDRVCSRVCEIENHAMITYEGNYTQYLAKKEKRDRALDAAYDKQLRERQRQQQIINRLRDYNSIKSVKRAASREKALSHMDPLVRRSTRHTAHFSLQPNVQSGDDVLMVEDLSKSFGPRLLFDQVGFEIHRGEHIGVIGKNGIGKTTLFQILIKHLRPDTGRVVYGHKVFPGYYAQELEDSHLSPQETLIDAIRDVDSHLDDGEIRSILAPFLFTGDTVFRTVDDLSGGEKARLNVARLMVSEANFLLMDEPTNHIDMPTREVLEDALTGYAGTLLFISHDRYFLNKVADKIFELTPEGIRETLGNYDDYENARQCQREREDIDAQARALPPNKTQQKLERKRIKAEEAALRKEKQRLKTMEDTMEDNDSQIEAMEKQMCAPDFYDDVEKAQALTDAYHHLKSVNDALMAEWEKLATALENR